MVKIRALDCLVFDDNGRKEVKAGTVLEVPDNIADDFIAKGAAEPAHLQPGREKTAWGGEVKRNDEGLRTDGPTMEEWVDAGYRKENYPPQGWAEKDSRMLREYKREREVAELKAKKELQRAEKEAQRDGKPDNDEKPTTS